MSMLPAILLTGVIQGLFLALILAFARSPHQKANRWLAGFLIVFCLPLFASYLVQRQETGFVYPVFYIAQALSTAMGPLLLIYVQRLTTIKSQFSKADFWHLLPAGYLAFGIMFLLLTGGLDALRTHLPLSNPAGQKPFLVSLMGWSKGAVFVFYLIWARRQLTAFSRAMAASGDHSGLQQVAALRLLTTYFLVALGISGAGFLLAHFQLPFMNTVDFITHLAAIFFVFGVAVVVIRHPVVLNEIQEEAVARIRVKPQAQYGTSSLTEEDKILLLASLQDFMTTEKPYLDNELKAEDLARQLKVTPHHLSQVTNECLGLTFRSFINGYRLAEVKTGLIVPQNAHKTILAVALEAGFNSKAVFNRVFKETEGVTPLQYRQAHKN